MMDPSSKSERNAAALQRNNGLPLLLRNDDTVSDSGASHSQIESKSYNFSQSNYTSRDNLRQSTSSWSSSMLVMGQSFSSLISTPSLNRPTNDQSVGQMLRESAGLNSASYYLHRGSAPSEVQESTTSSRLASLHEKKKTNNLLPYSRLFHDFSVSTETALVDEVKEPVLEEQEVGLDDDNMKHVSNMNFMSDLMKNYQTMLDAAEPSTESLDASESANLAETVNAIDEGKREESPARKSVNASMSRLQQLADQRSPVSIFEMMSLATKALEESPEKNDKSEASKSVSSSSSSRESMSHDQESDEAKHSFDAQLDTLSVDLQSPIGMFAAMSMASKLLEDSPKRKPTTNNVKKQTTALAELSYKAQEQTSKPATPIVSIVRTIPSKLEDRPKLKSTIVLERRTKAPMVVPTTTITSTTTKKLNQRPGSGTHIVSLNPWGDDDLTMPKSSSRPRSARVRLASESIVNSHISKSKSTLKTVDLGLTVVPLNNKLQPESVSASAPPARVMSYLRGPSKIEDVPLSAVNVKVHEALHESVNSLGNLDAVDHDFFSRLDAALFETTGEVLAAENNPLMVSVLDDTISPMPPQPQAHPIMSTIIDESESESKFESPIGSTYSEQKAVVSSLSQHESPTEKIEHMQSPHRSSNHSPNSERLILPAPVPVTFSPRSHKSEQTTSVHVGARAEDQSVAPASVKSQKSQITVEHRSAQSPRENVYTPSGQYNLFDVNQHSTSPCMPQSSKNAIVSPESVNNKVVSPIKPSYFAPAFDLDSTFEKEECALSSIHMADIKPCPPNTNPGVSSESIASSCRFHSSPQIYSQKLYDQKNDNESSALCSSFQDDTFSLDPFTSNAGLQPNIPKNPILCDMFDLNMHTTLIPLENSLEAVRPMSPLSRNNSWQDTPNKSIRREVSQINEQLETTPEVRPSIVPSSPTSIRQLSPDTPSQSERKKVFTEHLPVLTIAPSPVLEPLSTLHVPPPMSSRHAQTTHTLLTSETVNIMDISHVHLDNHYNHHHHHHGSLLDHITLSSHNITDMGHPPMLHQQNATKLSFMSSLAEPLDLYRHVGDSHHMLRALSCYKNIVKEDNRTALQCDVPKKNVSVCLTLNLTPSSQVEVATSTAALDSELCERTQTTTTITSSTSPKHKCETPKVEVVAPVTSFPTKPQMHRYSPWADAITGNVKVASKKALLKSLLMQF